MATQTSEAVSSTAERILDVAERLAQTRGFNGFSYADVAAEVGITKASLHYHFATKAELGRALMARYSDGFSAALDLIAADVDDARSKLQRYVDLFEAVLVLDRLCLCGMFAAQIFTLPSAVKDAVRTFFDRNESWLADVLVAGHEARTLAFRGAPRDVARYMVATLEGAMLLAYSYGDVARFRVAAVRLLDELGSPALSGDPVAGGGVTDARARTVERTGSRRQRTLARKRPSVGYS